MSRDLPGEAWNGRKVLFQKLPDRINHGADGSGGETMTAHHSFQTAGMPDGNKLAASHLSEEGVRTITQQMADLPEVGESIPNGGFAEWNKTDRLPKMADLPDSAKPPAVWQGPMEHVVASTKAEGKR